MNRDLLELYRCRLPIRRCDECHYPILIPFVRKVRDLLLTSPLAEGSLYKLPTPRNIRAASRTGWWIR